MGWVCEAAAGRRFPELAGELVWSRLGADFDANIGIDPEGTGMFDGGMSAALCDLARFGAMIARDGTSLSNHQVVPEAWIADSFAGGPDSRQAFAASPSDTRMPGGMYRNQFWFPFARSAGAVVPRHPRADDLRQPCDRSGGSQAVELADSARSLEAVLDSGRLRCHQRRTSTDLISSRASVGKSRAAVRRRSERRRSFLCERRRRRRIPRAIARAAQIKGAARTC